MRSGRASWRWYGRPEWSGEQYGDGPPGKTHGTTRNSAKRADGLEASHAGADAAVTGRKHYAATNCRGPEVRMNRFVARLKLSGSFAAS
jgi:hypothetical protein